MPVFQSRQEVTDRAGPVRKAAPPPGSEQAVEGVPNGRICQQHFALALRIMRGTDDRQRGSPVRDSEWWAAFFMLPGFVRRAFSSIVMYTEVYSTYDLGCSPGNCCGS
jgi:hypothetical protein